MDQNTIEAQLEEAWSYFCIETSLSKSDANYDTDWAVFRYGWNEAMKTVEAQHRMLKEEVERLDQVIQNMNPPF